MIAFIGEYRLYTFRCALCIYSCVYWRKLIQLP